MTRLSTSPLVRVEMHCHTVASSDGMITPDGLLKAAILQKLDAIAITDHDTTEGAFEFQKWFRKKKVATEILIGEERTLSNKCHMIGLFLKEDITAKEPQAVMDEIHSQGGLILVPHPYRLKDGLLGPMGLSLDELAKADAYEIHNAKGSRANNDRTCESLPLSHYNVFGGSDAHYEADVGQCVCEIQPSGSMEETVRSMLHRRVSFRILAKPQSAESGERKYAPAYYAVKRYISVPRLLLPLAKKTYRFYWNMRQGKQPHALAQIVSHSSHA